MKLIQPTPEESKAAKRSFNFTLLTIALLCFTAIFCFSKMEKTTAETEKIAELTIQKNNSEARLLLARKGVFVPEYRPIVVSDRTVAAGTAYSPSSSRYTLVSVSASVSCALTISGGTAGNTVLQISPDNITYTTKSEVLNSSTGSLVIGVAITNVNGNTMTCTVPPGYYYKITNTSTTGTATFSILTTAQETNL